MKIIFSFGIADLKILVCVYKNVSFILKLWSHSYWKNFCKIMIKYDLHFIKIITFFLFLIQMKKFLKNDNK